MQNNPVLSLKSTNTSIEDSAMTQQEFDRLVALDIQRLVAKAQAEYEAKQAAQEANEGKA
jgi:hypothetical protein